MKYQSPEAFETFGWFFYDSCVCQGALKYKYRHKNLPGYEIEWWVKYAKFKVLHQNKSITSLVKITLLENELKNISEQTVKKGTVSS